MADPLEELLRRYRPAGPPAELRARIIVAPRPLRAWPWAAAAAALLILTVGLHLATAATARDAAPPSSTGPSLEQRVQMIEGILGDNPEARALANLIVAREHLAQTASALNAPARVTQRP